MDRALTPAGIDPVKTYDSQAGLFSWGAKMDGTPYYQYYDKSRGIGGHIDEYGDFIRDATPFVSYGDWFKRYFKTGLTFNNSLALNV